MENRRLSTAGSEAGVAVPGGGTANGFFQRGEFAQSEHFLGASHRRNIAKRCDSGYGLLGDVNFRLRIKRRSDGLSQLENALIMRRAYIERNEHRRPE